MVHVAQTGGSNPKKEKGKRISFLSHFWMSSFLFSLAQGWGMQEINTALKMLGSLGCVRCNLRSGLDPYPESINKIKDTNKV